MEIDKITIDLVSVLLEVTMGLGLAPSNQACAHLTINITTSTNTVATRNNPIKMTIVQVIVGILSVLIHVHNIKDEINTGAPNGANLIATHHRLAILTVIKDKLEAMIATRDSLAVMIAISGLLVMLQDPIHTIHAGRVVRKGGRIIFQISLMNTRYEAEQELFEGDYEHFDKSNSAQPHTHQTKVDKYAPQRLDEHNVTRLPDGRVLKGTPDEQHRDAEFWTEIAQESGELFKQVESSHIQEATTKDPADLPNAASTKRKPKPRAHTASDSTRERKTTKARVRQSTPKPRSTGPKPSQRGYKWPTPEE